jgi:mRNA interferase MazF
MRFQRGDIIDVFFDLPYLKETKTHPAIIISNDTVYEKEGIYICVMMTSSNKTDLFSFEITADMLLYTSNKVFSQARSHLISYVMEKHIVGNRPRNTLKENALNRLITRINNAVF